VADSDSDTAPRASAFDGLRVLDCSSNLSGAYAARLFGDWGADVVLAEPPTGHALRHEPSFLADEPGVERSVLHAVANWNKRSQIVRDSASLAELVSTSDVVVTTARPPWDQHLQTGLEALRPDAVHLSITPHGLDGPLATVAGNNLTASARSGWASINAYEGEAPLQLPVRQTGYVAGVAGFVAAASALFDRLRSGRGERVDVSELEALCLTCHPWGYMAIFEGRGWTRGPGDGRKRGVPGPLYETTDGQINFGFGDWHNWPEAMRLLGLPELADDPALVPDLGRHHQDLSAVIAAAARSVSEKGRWPLFHGLSELRCISGCVQDMADLAASEQLAARRYFVQTPIEGHGVRVPGPPVQIDPGPWSLTCPAPRLDEHARELAARPGPPAPPEPRAQPGTQGPLSGVRVLCFTQAWSGAFATELLALLGADVVQIEALHRPDVWRNTRGTVPAGVEDAHRRQHRLNTQGLFNTVNLNKRGITLNMATERGREIFWELVPGFDLIAENFTPGVLPNWGITLDSLNAVRPGMILASLSGYGTSGPYKDYPANGATTEPMSGLSSLHGYAGDPGMNTGGLCPDPISGYFFTAAILSALHLRKQTGEPQRIDAAMLEATAMVTSDAFAELDATGRVRRPNGNHHPRIAPHGVYATRGDDEWLALAAESDAAWRALAAAIGRPELSGDARFATMADRKANEEALDAILADWCLGQDVAVAEAALNAVGCAAARVVSLYELYDRPNVALVQRGFLTTVVHPESGASVVPGAPWRLQQAASPPLRPAPCLGEHSREVLNEELGISVAEYEELVSTGVSGTPYGAQ